MARSKFSLPSYVVFLSISSLMASDSEQEDRGQRNSPNLRRSTGIAHNGLNSSSFLSGISEEGDSTGNPTGDLTFGKFPRQPSSPSKMQRFDKKRSNSHDSGPYFIPTPTPIPIPIPKKSPLTPRNRTVSCDSNNNQYKTGTSPEVNRSLFRRLSQGAVDKLTSMMNSSASLRKEEIDEKTINSFKALQDYATFDQIASLLATGSLPDGLKTYGQKGIKLILESTKFEDFTEFNNIWLELKDRLAQAPDSTSVEEEFDELFRSHRDHVVDSFQNLESYATFDQVMCLIKTVPLSKEAFAYAQQGIEMTFRLFPEAHHPFNIVNKGWLCLCDRVFQALGDIKAEDQLQSEPELVDAKAMGEFNKTNGLHRTGILVKTFATYCEVFDKKYSRKQVVEKVIDIHDDKSTMEEVVESYEKTLTDEKVREDSGLSKLVDTTVHRNKFVKEYQDMLQDAYKLYQQALKIDLVNENKVQEANKLLYERAINSTFDPDERKNFNKAFESISQEFSKVQNKGDDRAIQAQIDLRFMQQVPAAYCERCINSLLEANGMAPSVNSNNNNSMAVDRAEMSDQGRQNG